jgi:hypothetical protein
MGSVFLQDLRMLLRVFLLVAINTFTFTQAQTVFCPELAPFFSPPQGYQDFGKYSSLASTNWSEASKQIKATWESYMGAWPPLLSSNDFRVLETTNRDNFVQKRVEITVAKGLTNVGWLLVPNGARHRPAVLIPYYEPETSVGLSKQKLRDFGLQLARRGFVTLSIGSPGGDTRAPEIAGARCQPLSFLAYIASNCRLALARMPEVDPERIGIVGHSYGGKWAMFAACLDDKFACGVWSDPGIVFDEARSNVNYWEPWYLGKDPQTTRKPGIVTPQNPRTGAYAKLVEDGHDLHELLALMAPRPFLVSGGSEDTLERWRPLNRVREVYASIGAPNRVGLTTRPNHDPTEESNDQIYKFFECALGKPSHSAR